MPRLRDRPRRVLLLCLGYGKQLTKQLRVSEPEAWQHLGISQLRAAPGHLPGEAVGAAGGSGAWTLPRKRPNLGFFRLGLGENLPGLSFPGWDLRFPWGGVPHPCGQRWGFPTVGTASSCTTQGWFPLCPTASTRTFWGCRGRAGEGRGAARPSCLPATRPLRLTRPGPAGLSSRDRKGWCHFPGGEEPSSGPASTAGGWDEPRQGHAPAAAKPRLDPDPQGHRKSQVEKGPLETCWGP